MQEFPFVASNIGLVLYLHEIIQLQGCNMKYLATELLRMIAKIYISLETSEMLNIIRINFLICFVTLNMRSSVLRLQSVCRSYTSVFLRG